MVNIPEGYRQLENDEKAQDGDYWFQYSLNKSHKITTENNNKTAIGTTNNMWGVYSDFTFIRKIESQNMEKSESIVVHCPNVEIFEAVQKMAFKHNRGWSDISGKDEFNIHNGYWENYKKQTCINLSNPDKYLSYGSRPYYTDKRIVTLADIDLIEKCLSEAVFKVGDWVVCKEGFSKSGQVGNNDNNYGGAGYVSGCVFQINSLSGDTRNGWQAAFPNGVFTRALRKATEIEIKAAVSIMVSGKAITFDKDCIIYDSIKIHTNDLKRIKEFMRWRATGYSVSIDHENKEIRAGCLKCSFETAYKIFEKAGV